MEDTKNTASVELTAEIVSAYVANNPVPAASIAALIEDVHKSLESLSGPQAAEEVPQQPAVPVRKSVSHDHITCLEDGRKFKSIKRHLATSHGMTPDEYRQKWGLKPDYPMVAPAYASARSQMALTMGLGRKREKPAGKARKTRARAG